MSKPKRDESSSHGVLRPYDERESTSRQINPVPPEQPSPYGLSQTLEGLILIDPCGLVSCRCRPWGWNVLQSFSPLGSSTGLITRRNPHDVLLAMPKAPERRPQGIVPSSDPFPTAEYCILGWADALMDFQPLPRHSSNPGKSPCQGLIHS
jgi:hypothetical protein